MYPSFILFLKTFQGIAPENWNKINHFNFDKSIYADKIRFMPMSGFYNAVALEYYGCIRKLYLVKI